MDFYFGYGSLIVVKMQDKTAAPGQDDALDVKSEDKENVEAPLGNDADVEADAETGKTLIKSPPEPTRVKSPEQIVVRSPDPVNWTVPLDTGRTFTVTQNIRGGRSSFHSCLFLFEKGVEIGGAKGFLCS